jgi:hypothetical protein
MNLAYNTGTVTAVLLSDGWHDVDEGTFQVGPYEFVAHGNVTHDGLSGFEFRQLGVLYAGPLSSVQAVVVARELPTAADTHGQGKAKGHT